MLTDYYFWFAQPSTILNSYDKVVGYVFAGLVVLAVLIWIFRRLLIKHPVVKKLINREANAIFWTGLLGVIWFGFRYEAVPIFSKRLWAGLIIIMGLIWLGFIKWYWLKRFKREKQEYDYNQVKNKYIS
jgi:hypothetical protein